MIWLDMAGWLDFDEDGFDLDVALALGICD